MTPFKLRVNNSSKYLPLLAYKKKFAEFPFLGLMLSFNAAALAHNHVQ